MNIFRFHFIGLILAFGLPVWAAEPAGETTDFKRYQIIVDRSPFGTVRADGAAAPLPNFATRFQFVGLVSSNDGPVQAILFDKDANRTYFCVAGDVIKSEEDPAGVTVVEISPAPAAKVVLRRGLEPATLRFEEKASTIAAQPGGRVPAPFMPGGEPSAPQPPGGPRRIPFRRTMQ